MTLQRTLQRLEQMSVEIGGNGPPVVMLHGLGGAASVFESLVGALGHDHRVIIPELPGSARSTVPLALSFDLIADRLQAMMDTLSLEKFHVVGHSLATLVAQQLALRMPDRVASLTLLGAMTEPPEAAREALRGRAKLVRQEGMAAIVDAVIEATLSSESKQNNPLAVALVRQLLLSQSAEGYALTCEALAGARAMRVEQIACPVMIRSGEDDAITPPSMLAELQDRIPNAESRVLPRCGHWTMLERGADCARATRDFLDRQRRFA